MSPMAKQNVDLLATRGISTQQNPIRPNPCAIASAVKFVQTKMYHVQGLVVWLQTLAPQIVRINFYTPDIQILLSNSPCLDLLD